MNVRPVACTHSVLVSPSGSSRTPVPNGHPTSRISQWRVPFPLLLLALVAPVSAAPPRLTPDVHLAVHPRQGQSNNDNNNSQSNGSISMSVWLPILLVTIVFVLFSFVTCVRRCATADAAARSTGTNRAGSTPANGNTTRPRRRPRRTPSQISTKSLPPYMKEPGDQELVLFGGPSEMEDDPAPPHAMPALAEDEDEHPEMRGTTFDIALDRIESVDTMADSSTTNLIRRVSASVPTRPPELHHAAMHHDHRRSRDAHSLDSVGSEAELLASHQRGVSVDNGADPRGEAPSYMEAVSVEGGMTTISLNDPEAINASVGASSLVAGRGRSRFSFLMQNPFSSHNHTSGALSNVNQPPPSIRSESPALHTRSGSALSRYSTHESHESHHSRPPSRNHHLSRSRSGSNSNLLRGFRSHSPGLHAGSSTISLDNISAPLTHTLTRAEFHAPKGGLMTAEQIKLITSREALEKFGVPYGPDAVAFSLSRERLAEMGPPPDFESVTGEHPGGGSATEAVAPRSTSPSQPSLSYQGDERGTGSRTSGAEVDGDRSQAQVVQTEEEDEVDEPGTARPMTPRTARPGLG